MWRSLISEEAKKFILTHESADLKQLALQFSSEDDLPFPLTIALDQIACRKKAKTKLPVWYANEQLIYPTPLSVEQCSSEITASFKASQLSGKTLVDLTGGLGVDSYFFAQNFNSVVHVEKEKHLSEISAYNFQQLGVSNITSVCAAAEDYLEALQEQVDYFYIDPARRAGGGRVFRLEETLPNVVSLKDQMLQLAEGFMLKASPLLDIQSGLKSLINCQEVFVLSVENECKELLFLCSQSPCADPKVKAINFTKNAAPDYFSFSFGEEKDAVLQLSEPKNYLYEPNAACMKAGAFKILTHRFPVTKLHASSHLYTSEAFIDDFPGRKFLIIGQSKPNKNALLEWIPEGQANVAIRNFPMSPDLLKKKLGLRDGGDKYVFGTTLSNQKKVVLVTTKVVSAE